MYSNLNNISFQSWALYIYYPYFNDKKHNRSLGTFGVRVLFRSFDFHFINRLIKQKTNGYLIFVLKYNN